MNKKLALLIGINYLDTESNLNGCINDVNNVQEMLIKKMGYRKEDIKLLTENQTKSSLKPTKNNILYSLYEIVLKARKNPQIKELWIHYSGHGTYIIDDNDDENDQQDECIVPLDFEKNGVIQDDVIQYYLKFLPSRVNTLCFFDSCHSGTVADLQYLYSIQENSFLKQNNKLVNSNIIMISGSKDDQLSLETYELFDKYTFLENTQYMGALTGSLLVILDQDNYTIKIKDFIQKINLFMIENNINQAPQLTSTYEFNSDMYLCINKKEISFIA